MFTIIDTTAIATTAVETETDLDKTIKDYRHLISKAYNKVMSSTETDVSKKLKKLLHSAVEVGIGIANEMYNYDGDYVGLDNYNDRLNDEVEEIGGPKATATEKCLIKQAIEAGIRANIKDIMIREGRYY